MNVLFDTVVLVHAAVGLAALWRSDPQCAPARTTARTEGEINDRIDGLATELRGEMGRLRAEVFPGGRSGASAGRRHAP